MKRIMIVEDDAAIVETLAMFLRYEGYEVSKSRSVGHAMDCLSNERPDLVLLDYMLQDDTAEPVVEAVRQNYGDEVVVVLFTAADDPSGKASQIGADEVI